MMASGDVITGEVDASSREEVARRVEYLGHLLIEIDNAAPKSLFSTGPSKRPSAQSVTLLLRQLSLLVGAGLTLEAALQTLAEDQSKAIAWFANDLRGRISTGESFAEALARHPTIIEPGYIAMVRAGEASGKLASVLNAIVEDRSQRELLAERLSSAIRYPAFLVASATLILVFFLLYVVPQFEPVFKDLGGKLNGGAAAVLNLSLWLRGNLNAVVAGLITVVAVAWISLRRKNVRVQIASFLAKLPGLSGPVMDRRTARIVGTLGLLVENGVPLSATLKILRDVVSTPQLVAAIDRVDEQVRNGRRFADALADADLLPPLAVRMLRVGDETGDLASIARHAARFYEHRLSVGIDRLMGIIGPVTIIAVSLIVGTLIISIMSALLSITELAT